MPDLPFFDDTHLPLDDPDEIEAIGRIPESGMWGRTDRCSDGGWVAFTTEPRRRDLAWIVRWHPERGRSVLLIRDRDASRMHMDLQGPGLLSRLGGYWWDGEQWYRPPRLWDRVRHEYVRRQVPAAKTVTVADLLPQDGPAGPRDSASGRGRILQVEEVPRQPEDDESAGGGAVLVTLSPGQWQYDLRLWAETHEERRRTTSNVLTLSQCVVTIMAPELNGDQLVGVPQMAEIAGIAASTLRAYIARGEAEVPPPQASINGRPAWARPVAEEWAEQRTHSDEGVAALMSATDLIGGQQPVGIAELWTRYTRIFYGQLWERPGFKRRWALRWRTQDAVRDVATDLGWTVAASLRRIIPLGDLAITIRHALLDEFAEARRLAGTSGREHGPIYGIGAPVARMLDWLIRHDPDLAAHTMAETVSEAGDTLEIPRDHAVQALVTALSLDGQGDAEAAVRRRAYLDRVLNEGN